MNDIIVGIIGIILGILIGKRYRTKYIAPDSNKIRKKIFRYKGKKYKFTPVPVLCIN